MAELTLNKIETDYTEMGAARDYENEIDRFVIWADVDFNIDDDSFNESVVFDCGQHEDVAIWENYKPALLDDCDEEQAEFLQSCLEKAGEALKQLKLRLLDANSKN